MEGTGANSQSLGLAREWEGQMQQTPRPEREMEGCQVRNMPDQVKERVREMAAILRNRLTRTWPDL
jgi:hypothetical protein